MNGYGGTILRVNLTEGRITRERTPDAVARDFLGGRGFGAHFLFQEVPKGADPLGPENTLIISSGPFAGMLIPGGGKCDFTCKSPLTGGYASASLGGLFTAEIKYAGLDSIILEGSSPRPVLLFIDGDRAELRDASSLWGKGTITVERALKEEFGEEFQIASIGPGGENLVSFASINHDWGRQAGRGGVGAVMGAKRLKAIAIHGTRSVPVADVEAYRAAGLALFKACKDAPGLKPWQSYGTTIVTSWCDEVGALPTRNFRAGSFEGAAGLYGPVMREKIVITDKGCFSCPSPCGKYSRMRRFGTYVEGPEYETIGLIGSNLGISDIEVVAQANLLCDELGIDTISTGNAIGWAIECFERGILTLADTDGLELRFGDSRAVLSSSAPNRERMWVGINVYSYSGLFSAAAGARMYTYRPSATFTCPPWTPNSAAWRTGASRATISRRDAPCISTGRGSPKYSSSVAGRSIICTRLCRRSPPAGALRGS